MREDLLKLLRCPKCKTEKMFELEVLDKNIREIRKGILTCNSCKQRYEIEEGIVDLLYEPPDFVRREAAGLDRFAEKMRQDGWGKKKILSLPNLPDGYWYVQSVSMKQICDTIRFRPKERLLDIGANTCWASNKFAEFGLDVVAIDITKTEMQGLLTAEYFLEANDVYFERVLAMMFDLPIASESFNYVFCCEVLHHNDMNTLRRTFREIYRVLRMDGQLLIVNETMKFPLELKPDFASQVREFDGYEHIFHFHEYYLAAKEAGFNVKVLEPLYHPFFMEYSMIPSNTFRDKIKSILASRARKMKLLRKMYLAYRNLIAGDVSLNLICTKRSH